jgi:(1->4)-alpha-D-glucan 1-alpha-D-glucosylmutase
VVFEVCHSLVRELAADGFVTGLRLDHVDGLYDPAVYFERLHEHVAPPGGRLYITVEKILTGGEGLRGDWHVDGTTGYDFLNRVNGVLVDQAGGPRLRRIYSRLTGQTSPFADYIYEAKKVIISASMASELNVLAHELNRISESDWRYRDFTLDSLQEALREIVACFPVYRTYVNEQGWTEFDQRAIDTAVARALRRNHALEPSIFSFIARMLLPRRDAIRGEAAFRRALKFAMKFQQYTGPVHAKGVEDTAFYRWGPLISLNEVGAEPQFFGITVAEFHHSNAERRAHWPLSMSTTATHDTKRGEDARMRINVLSEIPAQFRTWLAQCRRMNSGAKTIMDGAAAPDRADEYLYYQALLGAWPAGSPVEPGDSFLERMREYMRKATKEKKVHTSWIHPSEAYDEAVTGFVSHTLSGRRSERFRGIFAAFHARVARFGMLNSLSQLVLKLCSPGVPDFYQGRELWDFSLVDPDNRAPVDFELCQRRLSEVEPLLGRGNADGVRELLEEWVDGGIKMLITAAGLRLRREWKDVFLDGSYEPVETGGSRRDHVVAFQRRLGERTLVAVAPRLFVALTAPDDRWPLGEAVWQDTSLMIPDGTFTDSLSGSRVTCRDGKLFLGDVLRACPVAILTNSEN